jgi:hypothetical protein
MKSIKLDYDPKCPKCNTVLDGAIPVDGDSCAPKDGDFTLCAYCKEVLTFKNQRLELLQETDLDDLPEDFLLGLQKAGNISKLFDNRG